MNVESFDSLSPISEARDIKGQSFASSLDNYKPKKALKCHFEFNFNNF